MKNAILIGAAIGLFFVAGKQVMPLQVAFRRACVNWGTHFPVCKHGREFTCVCGMSKSKPVWWFDKEQFSWQVFFQVRRALGLTPQGATSVVTYLRGL